MPGLSHYLGKRRPHGLDVLHLGLVEPKLELGPDGTNSHLLQKIAPFRDPLLQFSCQSFLVRRRIYEALDVSFL